MTHPAVIMGYDLGDSEQGQLMSQQEQDHLHQTPPETDCDCYLHNPPTKSSEEKR